MGNDVAPGKPAVLEDPTGRRARWLGWAGRGVFLLFLAWLLAVVLGGLGLVPVPGLPLVHALRPSQGPPPLVTLPSPRPPSPSDLRPATPLAAVATTRTAPGRSAAAPGHTATTRGRSGTARGRTKTTTSTHGKSATAPGHTKTTSTTKHTPKKR